MVTKKNIKIKSKRPYLTDPRSQTKFKIDLLKIDLALEFGLEKLKKWGGHL